MSGILSLLNHTSRRQLAKFRVYLHYVNTKEDSPMKFTFSQTAVPESNIFMIPLNIVNKNCYDNTIYSCLLYILLRTIPGTYDK